MQAVEPVPLHLAARSRYLNYALSVITSRALPDVRDGLKPVQRRILFTMFHELSLHPTGRYRKCAAVVGEVMGKFHPHGDQSIYDAMVRMAQDFSLRNPLVDGQGNFGSLDGDRAAAMRYTECRLRPLAEELLTEIKKDTVEWRPNYDGQRSEPVVLPAQFPQVLVNGSEGIAVGMATRIPPHNLGEVIDACVALIDDHTLDVADLMQYIKGPDFPTGGRILASHEELLELYQEGRGKVRIQAESTTEKDGRRTLLIITSVPFGQNKAKILEGLGNDIAAKKLPQVIDLRDESTNDVRIVMELKQGASQEAVLAWLYKHTALEALWHVNLTVLVPSENPDVATPARLNLYEVLRYWLDFRFETVRRRFEYELRKLLERIHILEGFVILFDALDEAIRIIRASEGRRSAGEGLMDRFDLSELQTDAILDMQLYKLSKMQIDLIREELEEKLAEANRIEAILASNGRLWNEVKNELLELRRLYADPRRCTIGESKRELAYEEDVYIVKEDAYVVVTRDGWIKRQSSFSELEKIRVREDDEVGWLYKAHTRSTVTFFTSTGSAYVMRVDDVPATTGYGEPLQRHFSFEDGERVVGVCSHDARHRIDNQQPLPIVDGDDPPGPYGVAMSSGGRFFRFQLAQHEDPSTTRGRKFARVKKDDAIMVVYTCDNYDKICVATQSGRAMVIELEEAPILKAAGMGVTAIKLQSGPDHVMACELAKSSLDGPEVVTGQGRELVVRERKFGLSKRGGKGNVVLRRGTIESWRRGPVVRLARDDVPEPGEE